MNTWKAIQRKIYDVLSHKYLLIVLFPFVVLTLLLLSLVQVGELWNHSFRRTQEGSISSNLGRICPESTEIDAVYTWVNGSDPFLLEDLQHHREDNEEIERWAKCPYPDCEPSHIVIYRGCDKISRTLLDRLPPVQKVTSGPNIANLVIASKCVNSTSNLILFSSIDEASKVIQLRKVDGLFSQGFWTTELSAPEHHPAPEWIRLSGLVPKFLSLPYDAMKKMLSKQLHSPILELWPNTDHSYVILKLPTSKSVDQLLTKSRVVTLGTDPVVASRIALVFNTPIKNRFDHYAPSRFEDKEELRYSLRSLEKHAPWIRHIYLVTNGQIPHWLDLDNPRITLVSHKDIFPNQNHLPTFSSPAIESHLHRIKGLSSKFLYLNDDIMFTQNVWPEDFYTNSRGYKVYLSWPVPDCSPTCLWSWVADGSCDTECNVEECGFDGGDCNETDSSPNSLKLRMPPEEFSVYDDMYDLAFENVDNILKNIGNVNMNYLQPPDPHLNENLKAHPKRTALRAEQEDDYLIRLNEPLKDYDHDQELKRPKRVAAKKNLGSHSYHGSSMIAGQSADFPGSVTNSEFARNEALLAANKLRDAGRPQGRHRSPFPQMEWNETSFSRLSKNQANQERVELGLMEIYNSSKLKFQKGIETLRNSSDNLPLNISSMEHVQNASHVKRLPTTEKQSSNSAITSLVLGKIHTLKDGNITHMNSTKSKQRFYSMMVKDLNKSVDQTLKKENHKAMWYRHSKDRILDSFAESLLHVNMLYNQVYGFEARRVPAHAPHLIDRHIMVDLQRKFPAQWEETSSHKLRSPEDMQFAFSYFYYLMSEEVDVTVKDLFDMYDTDKSGTWSDREIRTLMTRIYPAPLNPHHLLQFEEILLGCARYMPATEIPSIHISTPMYERYQDSPLPTVTWNLVNNCSELKKLMLTNLGRKKKYSYEVVREWSKDITFKMLHSNVSHLVGHLDDIRRNPKKFVCLNDNLDPKQEDENSMVRAVLRDFYHSFYPLTSKFELPPDMRNRFLHVSELAKWKDSRARLKIAAILAVVTLCLLTFAVICPEEVRHYGRRIFDLLFCMQRRRSSRTRGKSRSPVRLSNGSRSV